MKARTELDLGFFEDLTVFRQREALASHFKFCQGHDSNSWGHDLSGNLNREVGPVTFKKATSDRWKGEQREDDALYSTGGAAAAAKAPPGNYLLPDAGSAIDMGWVKPPIYDPLLSFKQNAFGYSAFALTNLRGFTNGKDLRMWIYRGRSTNPQNLIVGPLRGASIDRNLTVGGRLGRARYRLSYLSVGRMPDYIKLMNTVKRPINMGKVHRGRGYDYIQQVTVVVSGFVTENGPRKKVSKVYFLVYNEGEERDPEIPIGVQFQP